jgi:hypothetical protein
MAQLSLLAECVCCDVLLGPGIWVSSSAMACLNWWFLFWLLKDGNGAEAKRLQCIAWLYWASCQFFQSPFVASV